MNKADLVKIVLSVAGTQEEAKEIVSRLFDAMKKEIQGGGKVVVHEFGSFHVVMRKSKPARNPRTGEPVMIPPRRRIKFKMGKNFL